MHSFAKAFYQTKIGRLRAAAYLEGTSLLVLVFIGLPAKYAFGNAAVSHITGPVHGALFVLFLFNVLSVSVAQQWSFRRVTWKVLLACMIPFGTFYVDRKILRHIADDTNKSIS